MAALMKMIPALGLAGVVVGAGLMAPQPVAAAEATSIVKPTTVKSLEDITPAEFDDAIAEAHELGLVSHEETSADGSRTTTIDLGRGFTFDVVQPKHGEGRIAGGSDAYGKYVSFTATDQGAILSGAGWALGAGLCVVSAGIFCVVAGAIVAAATFAVTKNGIRCGTKALRVYPFSGHKPRCA